MSPVVEYREADNPYRSPATGTSRAVVDPDLEPYVAELRAFVGSAKADYYIQKWAPRLENPAGDVGWNWAAFLLPGVWTCYRKMYKVAAILFGISLSVAILQQIVFVGILKNTHVPNTVNLIVNLVTAIICGVYGNAWYLSHAQRVISDVRAQGYEDDFLYYAIAKRGGTNLLAGIGIPILVFFVAFVVGFMMVIFSHAMRV